VYKISDEFVGEKELDEEEENDNDEKEEGEN
jgi:hypothetical protein